MSYALSSTLFRLGFSNLWVVQTYNYTSISSLYLYFKALFWRYKFILISYKLVKFIKRLYIYFYYYQYKIFEKKDFKKIPKQNLTFWHFPKIRFLNLKSKKLYWVHWNFFPVKKAWWLQQTNPVRIRTAESEKKWRTYVSHFFIAKSYKNKKIFHKQRIAGLGEFLVVRRKWEKPNLGNVKSVIKKKIKYLNVWTVWKKK